MRIRILILIITQLSLFIPLVKAQCPVVSFFLPDTVCAGENFQIVNASTGGNSVLWNLCPGQLQTTPQSSLLPNDPSLNTPQQLRIVSDNGNHYLFVANLLGHSILRYDFGTDINSTPVVFDYGNPNGLLSLPAGIEVINDNGTWYAFVSNIGTNSIARVNLGSTISNNTANATNVGSFSLDTPRGVKIVNDAGNYFAFISSVNGNVLTKISFGNSLANAASGFTTLSSPSFDVPWGFDIAFDCTLNSWIGFYASNALSVIHVIDFGTTLTNQGTIVSSIPCIASPSGIGLTRDGDKWYILLSSFTTSEFQKIKLSGNLLSGTASTIIHTIPAASNPRSVTIFKDEGSIKVFAANNNPSSIGKIEFTTPCSATPGNSNDPVSISPTVNLINAYQPVVLEVFGPDGKVSLLVDSIFIQEAPATAFSSSSTCEGDSVYFANTSVVNANLVTEWQWDFGDSSPISNDQNPVHLFPGPGIYNVTLTASYIPGCSKSFSDSVEIKFLPEALFSFQNNICQFTDVQFNDLSQSFGGSSIVNWSWDFDDGTQADTNQNALHSFLNPGSFNVVLTVTTDGGCLDSISSVINILPSPQVDYIVASTCIGDSVNFINATTIVGGGSIAYLWNFGDSSTSTLLDPNHQYPAIAANYTVTLIGTATNGCKDTLINDLRISNKPVPQFSFSPSIVCMSNQVSFISSSFGTGGDTISAYHWDFGDNITSSSQNPFHAYADTGFYDVTLTVISPTACDSSISQQIYVIQSPTGTFTAANVCDGQTVNFNPLTSTPLGTQIDSIVWSFGDGNSFTGLNSPSHTYQSPGVYIVQMTVYNNLLCIGEYIDSVFVYSIPVADFTSSFGCSGSIVSFDGSTSMVAGDSISSWLWNFAGLGSAIGVASQFTFQNAGNYDVTLIVTSSQGCQDTVVVPLQIIQSPQFDFTFNEPCLGLPSTFNFLPLTVAPSSLIWNFGDGTNSFLLDPSHVYTTAGTFQVVLTVMHNATGCSSTLTKSISIKPFPKAGFVFSNNCEDLPILFTDTSTIASGSIALRSWNFGVLGNSGLPNPTVTPTNPGNYPVVLTVTSNFGCVSSSVDTLIVFARPEAAFVTNPLFGSPPLTVSFINQSTGGSLFSWDFGDGETTSGTNPGHIYQDTGTFNTVMIAESVEGCLDTTYGFIYVIIPYLDIAVNKVFVTETENLLKLTAELLNMGNVPVSSLQLTGMVENGSLINEAWTGLIAPGATFVYNFNARYDINSKSLPGFYCIEALLPNNSTDQNPDNNSKCAVIGGTFEVYSAFPNPFINQLSVNFNLPVSGDYDLTIHDVAGKLVYNKSLVAGFKGYNRIDIPVANLNKGIYAISIRFKDQLKYVNVLKY